MSRLADYFVVIAYDHIKQERGRSVGKIIQRFPEKDWPNSPFIEGIELFCQPCGWSLSVEKHEPKFFVSVLTGIDANRHYCASLCFHEPFLNNSRKSIDEDDEEIDIKNNQTNEIYSQTKSLHNYCYIPKCLVLISNMDCFEVFKNCLGIIYTVYNEDIEVPLETLVGNILGCIKIPPDGGPQIRFSIGAGDRQSYQPPQNSSIPITQTGVYVLFKQLGIRNSLAVFCAVMTENKILLYSSSYTRLNDTCRALTALMFPFRYNHVYIPLLPVNLLEILSTPTPFIIGIDSCSKNDLSDLTDVILVDLDGGTIDIPESVTIPNLPKAVIKNVEESLFEILQPDLVYADYAFTPTSIRISQPVMIDKEIRAVFLRMFACLFQGYRQCLTIIRIFPKPVIMFHKAEFLSKRFLTNCDFCVRLFDCMFFTNFIEERGCPWRVSDLWDDLYTDYTELNLLEINDLTLRLKHVQNLAQKLYLNENPCVQCSSERIPIPNEQRSMVNERVFPLLDPILVQNVLEDGLSKNDLKQRLSYLKPLKSSNIAMGPNIQSIIENQNFLINSTRKVDVLKNCIRLIFDNKITDAKKTIHAVSRVLNLKEARLTLCEELSHYVTGNKAILEHQQFDLVVRLINCALQYNSVNDECGLAYSMLPLVTSFCRKLCTGIIQFAFTCIQDHAIWKNQQFWERAFYQDVEKDIKAIYVSRLEALYNGSCLKKDFQKMTALELAAEQLKISANFSRDLKLEFEAIEESMVYSQAIHYANRMVYLMIPLDVGTKIQKSIHNLDEELISVANSYSITGSDSVDVESNFDDQISQASPITVIRAITRFIDKICVEGGVSNEHIKSLYQMIPGVVHMHIETLESVYKESKRLPTIPKPIIILPSFIYGEKLEMEGLRAFLLHDGREDHLNSSEMLPAEGAIFLTNYRIIFQGIPCDSEVSEQLIIRAFPITSLTKEKRITLHDTSQEGLQLRSSTFQLIKIAFDNEVKSKNIELFRKCLNHLRYPEYVFDHFAFSNQPIIHSEALHKTKEKNSTLKRFAKRTFLRTAQKAGYKHKNHKYIFPNNDNLLTSNNNFNPHHGLKYSAIANSPIFGTFTIENSPELVDESNKLQRLITNSKTFERSLERIYIKDWKRMGLFDLSNSYKSNSTLFRITKINSIYLICKSYPSLFLVPKEFDDESVRKLCKSFRQNRLPVITFLHKKTRALLLRGASFVTKGVIDLLKGHHSTSTNQNSVNDSTFMEQQKYFELIINITQKSTIKPNYNNNYELCDIRIQPDMALNTLSNSKTSLPPNFFNRFNYLQNKKTLRLNNEKFGKNISNNNKKTPILSQNSNTMTDNNTISSSNSASVTSTVFYLFGDKSQLKILKNQPIENFGFIPIEYFDLKETKTAYKKLMRACVPSSPPVISDSKIPFFELIEESKWLYQIENLLDISNMIIDKIDKEACSVAICLEDGWDVTAQISSIVQLCLDPYYRTLEGFRYLIEKEWLTFGHKFNQRSNLTANRQSAGLKFVTFTPIFIQFLDCVFQIQKQFPTVFEFNEFYLRFLAYHTVSCRYRQFLFDNEFERFECGILANEDKFNSLVTHKTIEISSEDKNIDFSLFDFINIQHLKSPIFYNFLFLPNNGPMILHPKSQVAHLELWNYYLSEELANGPSYDLDNEQIFEKSYNDVIANGIDNLIKIIPNEFTHLLDDINTLEEELMYMPLKWKTLWDKFEIPLPIIQKQNDTNNEDIISLNSTINGQLFRKKLSQKKNFFNLRKNSTK